MEDRTISVHRKENNTNSLIESLLHITIIPSADTEVSPAHTHTLWYI